MSRHGAENDAPSKCRYMQAAYPDLDAEDTCNPFDHRHDTETFSLARALAARVHECDPDDEQVAWFLNDAGAVVDDFDPAPDDWEISALVESKEHGVDFTLTINGVAYVIPVSAHKEESHPVSLAEWRSWGHEADDEPQGCDHEWLDRETRVIPPAPCCAPDGDEEHCNHHPEWSDAHGCNHPDCQAARPIPPSEPR